MGGKLQCLALYATDCHIAVILFMRRDNKNCQIAFMERPIILRTPLNSNDVEFISLSSESLVSTVSSNVFKGSSERGVYQRSSNKNNLNKFEQNENLTCSRDSLTPSTAFDHPLLCCRKSHSMINIKGPRTRTPSPRASLTPVTGSGLTRSARLSLTPGPEAALAAHTYSFHWRRRSTSFLQPRWAARKFRSDLEAHVTELKRLFTRNKFKI